MATNPYFKQGVRSEQTVYEDIIIEALKMYGQDVYYLPREIVNKDTPSDFATSSSVFPCDNASSTSLNFATISSGLWRFLVIARFIRNSFWPCWVG